MKIPVFARLLASVTALTFAAPTLAQDNGSVSSFELPTETPTPRSEVQGPVVEGIAAPRATRASPTPAPAAIESGPLQIDPGASSPSTPRPQASPDAVRSAIDNFGAARAQPVPAATNAGEEATAAAEEPAAQPAEVVTDAQPQLSLPEPDAPTPELAAPSPSDETTRITWWLWALTLLAVGAMGTAIGWFLRDRKAAPLMIEAVEYPADPEPAPEPVSPPAELPKAGAHRPAQPQPAPAPAQPVPEPARAPTPPMAGPLADDDHSERALRIALEPSRLSVTLMNATLSYRILLTNQGEAPLRDISIDGDMISAHASLSEEEQLAAANSALESRHLIRTLFPGETKVVSGDFTLPLPMIRPIRKGNAALFVPLARLRVVSGEGEHVDVLVQTSVVGQRSPNPGGGLQPFRLDLGPRIYSELAQRSFA